jgi:2-oxoglutarate dehydrogenase E2 component (dihydrolipoamide succinyltransferase)
MGLYKLLMPKMGEGVIEATIINWLKSEGEAVAEDETILEVATDKVDTEIQSPVSGIIKKINFPKDTVVPVGETLVLIEVEGYEGGDPEISDEKPEETIKENSIVAENEDIEVGPLKTDKKLTPLVRKMLREAKIGVAEIELIRGTGANGKITKRDVLYYLEKRQESPAAEVISTPAADVSKYQLRMEGDVVVHMDRVRKLISQHMVDSKRIAPHVTSVVEADLTDLVNWRNNIKKRFQDKHGQNFTFLPLFTEACVKALKDFPGVNASVEGNDLILRKKINIGFATALPNGNLIVPIVKNAGHYNLEGLALKINDLVSRARDNKLNPDEISGGTFTITNLGTMGNIIGTPIINQPQVAVLATGAIVKKPAVLESEFGDVIAIRHMMYLSLSYDHRVVDGFLGGSFLRRIADYLENFDTGQSL